MVEIILEFTPNCLPVMINELLITMAVFFVMVGVWSVISKNLVRNSIFKEKIGIYEKYLHLLMPLVLIGLGIIIIIFNAF